MIVAGLGYRKAISAAQIEAAIDGALRSALVADTQLEQIAVPSVKADEPAPHLVATARGVRLTLVPQRELEAASPRTLTRSVRSLASLNVHSVAEAAALAAAGPDARLLAPRIAVGPVTCALAQGRFP